METKEKLYRLSEMLKNDGNIYSVVTAEKFIINNPDIPICKEIGMLNIQKQKEVRVGRLATLITIKQWETLKPLLLKRKQEMRKKVNEIALKNARRIKVLCKEDDKTQLDIFSVAGKEETNVVVRKSDLLKEIDSRFDLMNEKIELILSAVSRIDRDYWEQKTAKL